MSTKKNSSIPVLINREPLKSTNTNLLNRQSKIAQFIRRDKTNLHQKKIEDVFSIEPTREAMNNRDNWPDKSKTRPNLEQRPELFKIIYNNATEIARMYFQSKFYRKLFPPDFDSACNAYISGDITAGKQTFGYTKKNYNHINLADGLSDLMNLIISRVNIMLNLTDFIFLYISSILCICVDEGNQNSALNVLNIFLKNKISRLDETKFLFSSLLLAIKYTKSSEVHDKAIQAFARLCELDQEIMERIEVGSFREDAPPALVQICKEVLKFVPKELLHYSQFIPKTLDEMHIFSEITSDFGPESATKRLEELKNVYQTGHFPPQPIEMLSNTVETMKRLISEKSVIVNGFQCIQLLLPQCLPAPSVFGEVLALASHFPGEEYSEAIFNILFSDSFDVPIIVQSLEGALSYVADPNDIQVLMERFGVFAEPRITTGQIKDFYLREVVNCLMMHEQPLPNYLNPFANQESFTVFQGIEESIKKLMTPDTVFEETEKIVLQGDGSIIEQYPLYLRGYLHRAFLIYRRDPAPGMSQQDQERVSKYQKIFNQISPEELESGQYSFTHMAQQFKALQEKRTSLQ